MVFLSYFLPTRINLYFFCSVVLSFLLLRLGYIPLIFAYASVMFGLSFGYLWVMFGLCSVMLSYLRVMLLICINGYGNITIPF